MTISAIDILKKHGNEVEAYLAKLPECYDGKAPPKLVEAMQYSLMAGGKRLRPALILECFDACKGTDRKLAVTAAAAMELIHTFSLVHDDLPAMDDDDLRRGRPTNHKIFGEAMAILAGDAMVTVAFEIIAVSAKPQAATLVYELSRASGPCGMIGGQVLDLDGENQKLDLPSLQKIHRAKTGALLTASCRMGAIAAGASEKQIAAVTDFGKHLGLAFQIVDDILDETSTPEQMGKATKKDAARGKNTYPSLMGLESSKKMAEDELAAAVDSIKSIGESAQGLVALAKFVVERDT